MLQKNILLNSWGIGISPEQANLLRQYLGEEHTMTLFDSGTLPGKEECECAAPFLLWVSPGFCRDMLLMPQEKRQFFDSISKVLLLDANYSLADFEVACDCGITEIVRHPLTKERTAEIMRRALEAQSVHYDVQCMTREIILERELLERKNELLSFLVNFLTNTTESLDLEYILQTAFTGLTTLLPVRSMHAVLWEQDNGTNSGLSLFICSEDESPAYNAWRSTLVEQAGHVTGQKLSVEEVTLLHFTDQSEGWYDRGPEEGVILSLPIINGTEQLGILLLQTSMERHLGRDQAMALDSAMRHFALSIKNAHRFRLMQMYADYDSLTKVHSRRHFEGRLEEEMQRFNRYGQSVSLIMLDIDYFKAINDNRGHHVGDLVLREVAAIVAESIRLTDYCARYGGEEFVIILPHTSGKNAQVWAERMRKRIAAHKFMVDGDEPVQLTVSMGIASLASGGATKNKQALICEADAALYSAKQKGRNRICDCTSDAVEAQAMAS